MATGGGSMNKANSRQHSKNAPYYKNQFLVTERNKKRKAEKEKRKKSA